MSIARPTSRRTFVGVPGLLTAACRAPKSPSPLVRDCPYGPGPSQRLDVFPAEPKPALPSSLAVMIHGGGWESGARGDVVQFIPPFTSRGYVVANVGYRVAAEAAAPAAAEDVRHAVEFARSRAAEWNARGDAMLLVGFSAGAHLALLSALAPSTALGGPRSGPRAIVSFWGMTDVADLLSGVHARRFAQRWLPDLPGRSELARTLSPVDYDAGGAPALCALHSVNDPVVPFAHSERLVAKFQQAGRPAKLIRLSHHGHAAPSGDYPALFDHVFRFLGEIGGLN